MSKSSTTTRGVATPDRVTTHPGEVLGEEFLNPLGMSVNALAMALRVPATRIGAIVKGAFPPLCRRCIVIRRCVPVAPIATDRAIRNAGR